VGGFSLFSKGKARGYITFYKPFLRAETLAGNTKHSAAIFTTIRTKSLQNPQEFMFTLVYNGSIIFLLGGVLMNEIISIGAYVPFTVLPLFAQDEIRKELAYLRSLELDDFNTECYLLHDSDHGFTVNVQYVYSDDEPPEGVLVYLDTTTAEGSELDTLITVRMQYALQHISEI